MKQIQICTFLNRSHLYMSVPREHIVGHHLPEGVNNLLKGELLTFWQRHKNVFSLHKAACTLRSTKSIALLCRSTSSGKKGFFINSFVVIMKAKMSCLWKEHTAMVFQKTPFVAVWNYTTFFKERCRSNFCYGLINFGSHNH